MKKKFYFIIITLFFALVIYYLITLIPRSQSDNTDIKILLIYNPRISSEYGYVLNAYKSVMEEEGIPFKTEPPSFILSKEPEEIVNKFPVIILPDKISRSLPTDIKFWIKEYLERGGNVALIYDTGSQNLKLKYLDQCLFSDVLGLNYVIYNAMKDSNDAYTNAYIQFKDKKCADFFQIPPGKTDKKLFINGYSYGQLSFPIARVETDKKIDKKYIYAYAVTESGDTYPAILLKRVFAGNLLYVNLPLGHLKAHSDDLLLRSILRTFLFKVNKIPHLMGTPGGKGGLVINWHIDWSEDWFGLDYMKKNGFFSEEIQYSMHNTAGDFTDKPGDGLGFDAQNKGRQILKSVLKYGELGSHGGWAHNWFYQNILSGKFGEKEIETYIVKNNKVLEKISGYPVKEYSAPNGVHPQPLVTNILERNGIIAYYYTGDSGSAPNRTFYEKQMVSKNVIAFPVLSYTNMASFFEMHRENVPSEELKNWLNGVLEFVKKQRTVRLIYSHSYDVPPYYPETLKNFMKNLITQCRNRNIYARPMSYFATFMQRFLKTRYRFRKSANKLEVWLKNPESLDNITVAIPNHNYKVNKIDGVNIEKDENYFYLTIKETLREKKILIDYIND